MQKGSGVLLPISALPSKYSIGSFGKEAYKFADKLASAKQEYWQVLPLAPTGYGDSPYQSCSAFSGNHYFIDLEILYEENLLTLSELKLAESVAETIDYGLLFENRIKLLKLAFEKVDKKSEEFLKYFNDVNIQEYSVYMTLKELFNYKAWDEFPNEYRNVKAGFVKEFAFKNFESVGFWAFTQMKFMQQFQKLKQYVENLGISIIGDIPIYVAFDSVDVWLHSELFALNKNKKPKRVAGVPPDFFSPTGQLWGNPLYNWQHMKKDNYAWWMRRLEYSFSLYSVVRIDHFRGFDRFYSIKANKKDATDGIWEKGPSTHFFEKLKDCNIIAEDLGVLDEGVYALMKATGYPGMKILQFCFDGDDRNVYKPSNYDENYVAYTGTHDNESLFGFIEDTLKNNKDMFLKDVKNELLKSDIEPLKDESVFEIARKLIELIFSSKANVVIVPMQDLMFLNRESRMNIPSIISAQNWSFRLKSNAYDEAFEFLSEITAKYRGK